MFKKVPCVFGGLEQALADIFNGARPDAQVRFSQVEATPIGTIIRTY